MCMLEYLVSIDVSGYQRSQPTILGPNYPEVSPEAHVVLQGLTHLLHA